MSLNVRNFADFRLNQYYYYQKFVTLVERINLKNCLFELKNSFKVTIAHLSRKAISQYIKLHYNQ